MDKIVICNWCGTKKTIKLYPSRADRGKYCSRTCVSKATFTGKPSGRKGTPMSAEQKIKLSIAHSGKRLSAEHRKNLSTSHKRNIENHPWWRGGSTAKWQQIKNSVEYKTWRRTVFDRDNYTCVFCGVTGVYIEADHIKPKAKYPDLVFEVANGRTLCKPCHRSTPTYGVKTGTLV